MTEVTSTDQTKAMRSRFFPTDLVRGLQDVFRIFKLETVVVVVVLVVFNKGNT